MTQNQSQANAIEILLVEDNVGDVRLTQEAFSEAKIKNNLQIANDGIEAMEYLRKPDIILPDVILLDLNMPRMDGREVLSELKKDDKLKHIPVVILTTSNDRNDIESSYALNASCFISKPVGFEQFMKVVQSIESFWLSVVRYPNK